VSGATGYWEDFEVGARYPTTSRTITEEDHLQFCKLVGYDVPLFVDEAYARTMPYGGRICPSHLTMSFSTAMTGRLFAGTVWRCWGWNVESSSVRCGPATLFAPRWRSWKKRRQPTGRAASWCFVTTSSTSGAKPFFRSTRLHC
jgi:acyl dehydratase